jgi:riboflavin biosynthesis pyrimidine reductase
MMNGVLRRIHPEPARQVTLGECYDVARPRPHGRPWVALCMVASVDGSTVVAGRSGALGNANDRQLVMTLRELAGIVLVGAGTVRAEGYGAPSTPGLRIGVVSNSGRVDTTSALFTSGAGFLILPEAAPSVSVEAVRAGATAVDLARAVAALDDVAPDARFVHAEGGPVLNGALAEAGLIDELNLTVSPRLVGGGGPRVIQGAPELSERLELAHLLVDEESFVFSRWVRRAGG